MQVIVLGSYSNALPGEDCSSGQAQPMHRMSDRAAFGSVIASDWQQLPVRALSCLFEAVQSPSLVWPAEKPHASCDKHAHKGVLSVRCVYMPG